MLPTIILVQDFPQRIFSDHHVEVGRVQLLPQVQDHRVGQVPVPAGQRLAQRARLLLQLYNGNGKNRIGTISAI